MITQKKKREELQLLRDEALEAYLNREDFQYDVNADALYQYYKDQYTQLGKAAMEDTMGQAAALTGGYGSSYAQNVGQQAYQKHLDRLGDVVPALYQLAYDRYQEKGNRLYQTYQTWADLEQQAADREQWEREYELEERKRQDAYNQSLLKQQNQTSQLQTATYQPDHWAMLDHYQKLGQQTQSQETAEPAYDNGNVSEGNIKTMQRVLGLQETGKWTDEDSTGAGGLTADKAWDNYQKGQLQNYKSTGLGLDIGNIKTMERVLGLEEDGYWSKEDQKAAGGLTAHAAWKNYQKGKLQSRAKSGMSVDQWEEFKKEQPKSSGFRMQETTPAVREFMGQMMTKEQASKRGITSKEWEAMVLDRLNHVKLSAVEFHQLEMYYGFDVTDGTSNTTDGSSAQKMSYQEYREKNATQKIDDLNTEVQQYFRDYTAFANSAVYDLQNTGYQNAASMQESRIQTANELLKRADTLLTSLETSGDIISGDYRELLELISSTREGVDSIMEALGGQAKYYSNWKTQKEYDVYQTTQKQLAEDPDRLNREIAVLENMYTIYEDLVTREISEAEEAKLARLRQQYSSLGELKAAIKEKKKYFKTVTQLQDQAKQADERAVWEAEYSDKSYAELQKILGRLDAGAEKTWLSDYADTKKTKDDWEKELTDAQADLAYYEKLRSERDRLMQFQAMSPDTPGYVQLKKQWEAYHNQFDGLDERIDALEKKIWEQERIVRYYDLSQNEDYAEKSQYYGGGDALQEMVNDPTTTGFLDNASTVGKLINPGVGAASLLYEALPYDNLQHMTDNERADFNYIYATEGKEAAKDYLEWLQYTLDERSMNKAMTIVSDATQSIPVLSQVTASLLSTPVALMGGTGLLDAAGQKLVNKITGENKPINYNRDAMFFTNASGTARGTVAQNIADATGVIDFDEETHPVLARILNGKSLADVYQLGMSMQDSAAVAALAVINPVLGKVGAALLGGAAGTQAMLDAVQRGATDEQALTIGILSGAFEMLFEKYELDSLLGQGKNFWQAFSINGLSNAAGESATEVANILADVAVMAEKSNWKQNINRYLDENPGWDYSKAEKQAFIDTALQVGGTSLGGWISGSTMGGGYSTFQNIVDNVQKNQQAYNLYGQVQQELVTEALELNPNNAYAQKLQGKLDSDKQLSGAQLRKLVAQNEAVIQKQDTQNETTSQIDKVNQNPTARNVGQLNATVQAANTQVNAAITPEDVTNMLRSKRVDTKTATGITDAIVASLNGQKLTKTQSERLSSALDSPTVLSVVSELMKKKAAKVDNAQKSVYDIIGVGDRLSYEDKPASWNVSNLEVTPTAQQQELISKAEIFENAAVAESSTSRQSQNMPFRAADDGSLKSGRLLRNGHSLNDMAELYAEKVNSNTIWDWLDDFPNAKKLSKSEKAAIKKYAVKNGLIPDMSVRTVKDSHGKTYRYVNFEAAGLVREKVELPEYLWSKPDAVQFKWLDNRIGGRPKGYTWHHSEIDGQMELVPMGIHRVYKHNGGRTINHWSYREGGR